MDSFPQFSLLIFSILALAPNIDSDGCYSAVEEHSLSDHSQNSRTQKEAS